MKKSLLSLFLSLALYVSMDAQIVNAYSFAQSSGTYTPITGGSLLGSTSIDEQKFVDPSVLAGGTTTTGVGFPIGFNFTYNGIVFDRIGINTNGWISFGQSSLSPSVNMASSSSLSLPLSQTSTATPALLRNRIGALAMDLQGQTGSALRIETTGTAPNRVCVIQWSNFREYNSTGDNFNFQIRLNETSNSVVFVYGSMTTSSLYKPQVGLSGTTVSDFNLRKTSSNWAATTTGTVNTDTCRLSATVKPVSGQTFTWTVPAACSGTPTAGTASAPASACSGVNFDLVLTGYSTGVSGLTFQWQSSSTLSGTYTPITGATSSTFTTSQTATTYYKAVVSCGSSSASSNVVTVTLNSPSNCYCTPPSTSCTVSDVITNVTLETINNTTTCGTSGYSNYTTPVPTLNIPLTYPISVTVGTGGTEYVGVWIDYNQSGTFDSTEFTALGSGNGVTINSSITVPNTALPGNTRMRVRLRYNTPLTGADACISYTYGETEDYTVTIATAAACSGTPVAGTASVSDDSVCSESFNLMVTGYTSGVSGLTFQWQSSSTQNGTFTNISGATTPTYSTTQSATTFYKCVVSCGSSSATSNVVSVLNLPFMDCYCASNATNTQDEDLFNVTVGTLNNSSTCTTTGGTGSVLNKYSDYTNVAAPDLERDSSVSLSIQVGTCGTTPYSNAVKVFIDYNQNGSFDDAGEQVYASDTAKGIQTVTGMFMVPGNALLGNTMMRVVCKETADTSTISACGTYSYGETEDYKVNITGISNVGIAESALLNNVVVYPNPTAGVFNIMVNGSKFTDLTINVIDIQGKVVYSSIDKNTGGADYNKQINLEGLAKGLYYVKVATENGVKVQKIVVQ